MSDLQQWKGDRVSEETVKRELTQRLGSIELATKVAAIAMNEIGGVHQYAIDKVTTTLSTAEALERSASYAGRMTPTKKEEIIQLTKKYLSDMLDITDETAGRLVDDLLRP